MYKKISCVLTVILCICIMAAAGAAVYAVGESGEDTDPGTSSPTVASETTAGDTGSKDSETEGTSSSNTSSDDSSKTSSKTSSSSTSSKKTTSSKSSGTTSKASGSSGKVKSGGANGTTKTFVKENFDDDNNGRISDDTPETEDGDAEHGEYADYEEGEDEDLTDHFVGRVVSYGERFYKWMYVPAIISVLCIVALLYINLIYKKRTV